MKLYSYGYLSAIMIHTSTHPCTSNSTIPAWQKIRQSHLHLLLPYEQYLTVTPECPDPSRAHPVSYSIGARVLSQGVKGWDVRRPLTCITVLRLRMSGAVYQPLLYAFTNMDGDNLIFTFLQVYYLGPLRMYTYTVHIHILSLGVK